MKTARPIAEMEVREPSRYWRGSFTFWRNCFIGLIFVSPLFSRMWFLSKVPDIEVPFDIESFCRNGISDDQNAFVHYREAMRLLDAIDAARTANNTPFPEDEFNDVLRNGWVSGNNGLERWLYDNREATYEWRKGTKCPDCFLVSPLEPDFRLSFRFDQSVRHFARVAEIEGKKQEAEGNHTEAGHWYLALLKGSQHLSRQGVFHDRLLGRALCNMAAANLTRWSENRAITSKQLRSVLDEVRAINKNAVLVSEALKAEYIAITNVVTRPDWFDAVELNDGYSAYEPVATIGLKAFYWTIGEPQVSQRTLRQILSNQLNEIDKPLSNRQSGFDASGVLLFRDLTGRLKPNQLSSAGIDRAIQRSYVTRKLVGASDSKQAIDAIALEGATRTILEIALAAQIHYRERGEFPLEPALLVPEYLDVWPIDPLDKSGQAIRYRRVDRNSAVVWSVGEDGNDDNGDNDSVELDMGVELKIR